MTQRRKLELELNKPTEITLLYDEPIVGESQYGNYYLYAVESQGEEYSFFAPESVHEKIRFLSKGESAIVTKVASQNGNKVITSYEVMLPQEVTKRENGVKSIGEILEESGIVESPEHDRLYQIMLTSLQDAVDIASQLGGMVDANRIGITLFIARSKTNAYGV